MGPIFMLMSIAATILLAAASFAVAQDSAGATAPTAPKAPTTPTTPTAPTAGTPNATPGNDASFMRPVVREAELIRPARGTAAAGVLHPPLEVVDAGREDIGPLATSLKSEPLDPRLPTGFHRVYRVPGSDSLLMRGNGALFAVFSESVYADGRAILPPGTVYHIGMPDMRPRSIHPDALAANTHASSTNGSGNRIGQTIDARLDLRVRPTRPLPIGQTEHAATDHARIEPTYTLDEYLNAARGQSVDAVSATPVRPSGPLVEPTPVSGTSTTSISKTTSTTSAASSVESSPARANTAEPSARDPYAYLKLGPARIARAD